MRIKKLSITLLMILCLTIALCACGKTESNTNNTTKPAQTPKYSIGVSMSYENEFYRQLLQGFNDAISDNFTDNNVTVNTLVADNINSTSDTIADNFIAGNTSLIFTIGEGALVSTHNKTGDIPIVASGVMDYQRVLNITSDKEWDKTTKMNITGVSSAPNISDVLSMMIEATPNIESVGILYCPNDLDSAYQNHILEQHLDEAGIKWKEYEFYSADISNFAASEIISYACDESSVLFIPAESSLISKMDIIKQEALSHNTPTIGGDEYIGADTLVSMYHDPYDAGYQAGKMAYEILVTNKKPGNMAIIDNSYTAEQKLYSGDISNALGYTFPKSFRERNDFLSTYKIGSKTERDNQIKK